MNKKVIYLAGGCFWGVEAYFSEIPGVISTRVGYANGICPTTTYEKIKETGHAECVKIEYDPDKVSLKTLLKYYFYIIDPTILNRQGNDIGVQYRTGIYYVDEEDLPVIKEEMENEQKKYDKPIVTEVKPLEHFCEAEEYHQEYLKKNPNGYCHVNLADKPKF